MSIIFLLTKPRALFKRIFLTKILFDKYKKEIQKNPTKQMKLQKQTFHPRLILKHFNIIIPRHQVTLNSLFISILRGHGVCARNSCNVFDLSQTAQKNKRKCTSAVFIKGGKYIIYSRDNFIPLLKDMTLEVGWPNECLR